MTAMLMHAKIKYLMVGVFLWFSAATAASKGVFCAILPDAISRGLTEEACRKVE
jgi:hypothetical protein